MTIDDKITMCREVSCIDGTELGDALEAALDLIDRLRSLGDDEFIETVLEWTEKECKAFLDNVEDDWIQDIDAKAYKYFTGRDKPEFKLKFKRGKKYIYQHGKKQEIVEFGYIGMEGHAICYPPGEVNGQDAMAINPNELKELK